MNILSFLRRVSVFLQILLVIIFSRESSVYDSALVQSKMREKVNFTKWLVLSSVVLFYIVITLAVIN